MTLDWTTLIAGFLGGGLLTAVFQYFAGRRTTLINDTGKIQEIYEKTLDDMVDRHDKQKLEWEKSEIELKKAIEIKDARLDESRQRQAELLITIEDMKTKLNKVGDDVNQITGDFKKFPMAGDRQLYGRRATDDPQIGA